MQNFNQAWVLTNMYLEIDTLPFCDEIITIKTWIVSMQDANSMRALEIWHRNKKISGALTHWTVLNTEKRKVENLALPFHHFTFYPERIPTKIKLYRIHAPKIYDNYFTQIVKSSDLDLVNHVNNVKYLEWCLDTIEISELLNQHIKTIHINFLREMHWKQTFEIGQTKDANAYHFAIKSNKNCCLLTLGLKEQQ
jgi:acyl-ACP thioesterase